MGIILTNLPMKPECANVGAGILMQVSHGREGTLDSGLGMGLLAPLTNVHSLLRSRYMQRSVNGGAGFPQN